MSSIYYWESVFFASLFGFVALYPAVISVLPYAAENPLLFLMLSTASIALFLALVFYGEFHAGRRLPSLIIISAFFAALTVMFVGFSLIFTIPAIVVWFMDAAIALFSFGFIIARHFLRRVERDLRAHAPKIIVGGLAVTGAALLVAHTLTVFPIGLIALIAFIAVLVAALP